MAYIVRNGIYYCSTESKHIYCNDNWGFAEKNEEKTVEKAIDKLREYDKLKNRNFFYGPAPIPHDISLDGSTGYTLAQFISDFRIAEGYFEKADGTQLCVGHYFKIQDGVSVSGDGITLNKTWVIIGFDTEYGKGPSGEGFNLHHITLMPTSVIAVCKFNRNIETTSGGYFGSQMHTRLSDLATAMKNKGYETSSVRYLLRHPVKVTTGNRKSNGLSPVTWSWEQVVLPTEVQLRGTNYIIGDDWNQNGEATTRFPLFRFMSYKYICNASMWLRHMYYDPNDTSGSNEATTHYGIIHQYGIPWHRISYANNSGAEAGLIPYILLGKQTL